MNKPYPMKVSYHKRWDSSGTVYDQAIKINNDIYNRLFDCIAAELALSQPRKKEYVSTSGYEVFLYPLSHGFNGKECFLTHTQTRFINLFLKLTLKDRNTCLLIRD